jgi:hypothetical protein
MGKPEREEVCGCSFGLPGYCKEKTVKTPGRYLCSYCDDAPVHRHCIVCGGPVKFSLEPVELRCPACERAAK